MPGVSQERFQQLAVWFEAALRIPPGPVRDEYVTQVSAGDETVREELLRLLESDTDVQGRASSAPARLPRFGSYQARGVLGVGGMGAVYRATREDGELRHEVAVKVVAGVMWSPVLDERFRRERQILAGLQHPYIARFLDGGITSEGAPYLVMEYVEGERIDTWCDHQRLTINARLELFLKVAEAVSYAHQKLIVHRDLKPSNILVTRSGEPRLLDFGVARTLQPTEGGDGQSTVTTGLFATPLYASPEVLRGENPGVGCDVYSLGVLLYEMLCGKRPFSGANLPPAAIVEQVLSVDAPPPSAAVPDNPEVAEARGVDQARALRRQLHGDLDAITGKALAKSPTDRYASVEQFAEDVRRYLAGYPVQASAVGALQRTRKFIARNKARVAALAAIALALIAGLVGTTWQARVAQQERVASDRRFNQARELARYLVFELQTSVGNLPGSTPVRAEMVSRSLEYLDRLSAERSNDEKLRVELANGYLQLADVLGNPFRPNIGQPARAKESYRKAIAILGPIAGKSQDNREARLLLARGKLFLGQRIGFSGESAEGRELVRGATAELGRLAARWPTDFAVRFQASVAYLSYAQSLSIQQGYVATSNAGQALAAIRESTEHALAALRLKPGDLVTVRQLSKSYKTMGDLTELHDRPGATPFFRKSLAALDQLSAQDRESVAALEARSSALLGLGWNLGNLGDYPASLAALEEARQIRQQASEQDPKNVQALYFRTIPSRNLAIIHGLAGHSAESLANFLDTSAIYDRLLARSPSNLAFRFGRAEVQSSAANLAVKLGRTAEAERLANAALPVLKQIAGSPDGSDVELAIAARSLLETEVQRLREPKLALAFALKSSQMNGKEAEIQEILAEAYWFNGDRAHAVESIQKALTLIEQTPTPTRQAYEKTLRKYQAATLP
ncbi:MAG: protein kinase [Bryobacteraceae bacterium]|jgi:non-specific serine/threonine protein kinase/serine/threonine-protein kinase